MWAALILPASVQDRVGGVALVEALHGEVKRLKQVWGDSHFDQPMTHAWVKWAWPGEVVSKPPGQQGFVVQPKRWIVERTFGWLGRSRRLAKDFERTTESSQAFLDAAMIQLMLRRLTR